MVAHGYGGIWGGFTAREAAEIRKIAGKSLGRPISLRSLDAMSTQLESAFRSLGRPFMQVSFPPQEITSGVIAGLICPARASQVLMAGKPAFGAKLAVA